MKPAILGISGPVLTLDEAGPFVEETQVTAYCLCVSPSEGTPS